MSGVEEAEAAIGANVVDEWLTSGGRLTGGGVPTASGTLTSGGTLTGGGVPTGSGTRVADGVLTGGPADGGLRRRAGKRGHAATRRTRPRAARPPTTASR